MRLFTLGTGAFAPHPTRGGPAVAVLAGGGQFLVDAGENVGRSMRRAKLPLEALDGIFLTHFHVDHIAGLPALLFAMYVEAGRGGPKPDRLTIFGPPGLENLRRGFLNAYGDWLLEPGFELEWREIPPDGELAPAAGLKVVSRRVEHSGDLICYGYRFVEQDKIATISGDSTFCEALLDLARGAGVFVCESGKAIGDRSDAPHLTTKEIGLLATDAGVGQLVLTHFVDPADEQRLAEEVRQYFAGELVVAQDGGVFPV
jgi:ribonuclease BN (tRNA processing enzyme)